MSKMIENLLELASTKNPFVSPFTARCSNSGEEKLLASSKKSTVICPTRNIAAAASG